MKFWEEGWLLANIDKDVVHHHTGGDKLKAGAADKAGKGAQSGNYGLAGGFLAKDNLAEEGSCHRADDYSERRKEDQAYEKSGQSAPGGVCAAAGFLGKV